MLFRGCGVTEGAVWLKDILFILSLSNTEDQDLNFTGNNILITCTITQYAAHHIIQEHFMVEGTRIYQRLWSSVNHLILQQYNQKVD